MSYQLYNSHTVFVVLILIASAISKDIYVSPNGSNNNSGLSPQSPLGTLQAAVNIASNGDVVHLAKGKYSGPQNVATVSKSILIAAANPLMLAQFVGDASSNQTPFVVSSSTAVSFENVVFSSFSTALTVLGEVRFNNVLVRDNFVGVNVRPGGVLHVANATFMLNSNTAVSLDRAMAQITRANFLYNALALAAQDSQVHVSETMFHYNQQSKPSLAATLHLNNSAIDLESVGVHNNSAVTGAGCVAIHSSIAATRTDFINNTVTGNGGALYLENSILNFTYGNLNNNTAANGAAVYLSANATAFVSRSNVNFNVATGAGAPFACTSGGFIGSVSNNEWNNIQVFPGGC